MVDSDARAAAAAEAGISLELLDLLVCPVDKSDLRLDGSTLICTSCERRYPIEDGVPNMLVDDDRSSLSPSPTGGQGTPP